MKVCSVYPRTQHCGIALYGRNYQQAVHPLVSTTHHLPTETLLRSTSEALKECREYDVVDVQYETGLYLRGSQDRYLPFVQRSTKPLIVSLHEVWKEFPWVYPRSSLGDHGVLALLRKWLYDQRHPAVKNYRNHCAHHFGAARILVHWDYQKQILCEAGIEDHRIRSLPHPVPLPALGVEQPSFTDGPLRLAGLGYFNPAYNYTLLLDTLQQLNYPWQFTWIGGSHTPAARSIELQFRREIEARGIGSSIKITGLVDGSTRDRHLNDCHCILALFHYRSSSGSIATAIGSERCIIATEIPLTRELQQRFGTVAIAESTPHQVSRAIEQLVNDSAQRRTLIESCSRFKTQWSYDAAALHLCALYNEVVNE
jgi:glycosyltransferase involved in cell wall biosynthesis